MPMMSQSSSSVERDAARGIARLCAAGLDSVSLRRDVLRQLRRAVPSDACFFNALDPETGLVTHGLGEDAPAALMRQFFGAVYPAGEAERIIDLARSGEVVGREVSDDMRELFGRMGFSRELRATFATRDEPWGLWCAIRSPSSRPFEDRERSFMRRIARPVSEALRAAALRDAARSAIDTTDATPGMLVIDHAGITVQRTPAAAAQLLDLADVGADAESLPSVVAGVLARQRVAAELGNLAQPLRARGQSGRWYTIQGSLTEPDAYGNTSAIVLIMPLTARDVAPLLAKLYGLSPREREIVTLVARGLSTREIATRLGISPYTVQEHLGHACERVGVRGRRALLARLFFDGYAARLHR